MLQINIPGFVSRVATKPRPERAVTALKRQIEKSKAMVATVAADSDATAYQYCMP